MCYESIKEIHLVVEWVSFLRCKWLELSFEELLEVGQADKYGLHSCRDNSVQNYGRVRAI